MSDALRRTLHEAAAAGQPLVADWVGPVRAGVRARRRRRAAQSGGAGLLAAVAVAAGLVLSTDRPAPSLLDQAEPSPSATSSPSPVRPGPSRPALVPGSTMPAPTASARSAGPDRPEGRALDPALGRDRDRPGPMVAAPATPPSPGPAVPRASATPAPARTPDAPAPSSPQPSSNPPRSPQPAPTAGTQQVTVQLNPEGTDYPAGEVTITVTAVGDAETAPRVLALRVDGEPVEADAALDCRYPSSAPPRGPQRATRSFTITLPPGDHLLEAVADSGCSWYRGRGRTSRTVTAQ